jgi:curved DNA-binding protein CbpA
MNEPAFDDYYELLQISPNADQDTIERIYRLLAKKYHPDNPSTGSPERFNILSEAYNILADPEKRAAYDVRYERAKKNEWKTLAALSSTQGLSHDARIRRTILSILYIDRRDNPANPGVGNWQLEQHVGLPEKTIEFHIWYLKEKKWIALTDTGGYAITAEGVDAVESDGLIIGKDLLLTAKSSAEGGESASRFIEESTPSRATEYRMKVRSLERKIAVNPENITALVGLAHFHGKLGQAERAARAARAIRRLNPHFTARDFEETLQLKFQVPSIDDRALLQDAGIV